MELKSDTNSGLEGRRKSLSDRREDEQTKWRRKRRSRSRSGSRKRRKRKRHRSTDSDSSIDSESDSSISPSPSPKQRKKKRKSKRELDSSRKKAKHKHKHGKMAKKRLKSHISADKLTVNPERLTSNTNAHPSTGSEAIQDLKAALKVQSSKVRGPMTKEEYEKQQSVVRRVFDPDTGRHRLVRGDGEIIEEIVSRERQKAINKQATIGDGYSFQVQMKRLQ